MTGVTLERRDGGVVVLTLTDPDRRNPMTEAMGDALSARCAELASDRDLRAVVLTGAPPAFSAGGDLDMLAELGRRAREEGYDASGFMRGFYDRFLRVSTLPVPVVAAVNGHAIGAGLCVALGCDLRIVAEDARVGLNFSRLGLYPGMGATWHLPRLIGPERAAAWLYTGSLVTGGEAARQGLALEAVPAEEVLPRALALAAEIATASPVVVRQLTASLRQAPTAGLDATLDAEAAAQAHGYGTADFLEGIEAARARRPPTFPGG